ncbi:MAG: MFS transporter [Salinivirgaceae bacterium]|nr:MAG: MFS transporter [Salinivirgaceae bacterium]
MKGQNWHKFPILFSLYIAQSIPMSFFSTVVPVIMRQENYSLESIGLLQLVKLPWILKFLWAPLIDKKANNSNDLKRWIIGSELFYAVIIFTIGFLSLQTDFQMIVILMIIAFTASATQDIATDAFAVLILKKNERSLGNSVQSAGSFIGSLMGTGVLLIAYHYFGWQALLWILAGFVIFVVGPLPYFKKKSPVPKAEAKSISPAASIQFFTRKGMWKRLLLLLTYYSGIIGILAMLKPYMVDLGYTVKEIGFMSGIFGTAVAAGSAFLGGAIQKRIGRRTALKSFAILNLLVTLYFIAISINQPNIYQIYTGIALLWGTYGFSSVIIYTTSMDIVRKGYEGTDFTVQIVISHLSGVIFAVLSGKLAGALGYTGLFASEAGFALLAILIVFFILHKNNDYANIE